MTQSETIPMHEEQLAGSFLSVDGWLGFAAKQGIFAVLLFALLYFLAYVVFVPMQDESRRRNDESAVQTKAFQDAIIKSNEQHAAAASITSKVLVGLEENSRQTLQVLQRIEIDQRRGAWNEKKGGGSGE